MTGDLIGVYKIFHENTNIQCDHFFEASKTDKTRNSERKISVKQFHSNMGRSAFSSRVITNWNDLPAALKFTNNINLFKNLPDKDLKFKVQY